MTEEPAMTEEEEKESGETSSAVAHTHATPGRRAPAGEGVSAPYGAESDGPPQMSVFDGAGNESVVVLAENEDGRVAEGTGANLEEALKDAEGGDSLLGDAFNPDQP